jgi:hypothetical protein
MKENEGWLLVQNYLAWIFSNQDCEICSVYWDFAVSEGLYISHWFFTSVFFVHHILVPIFILTPFSNIDLNFPIYSNSKKILHWSTLRVVDSTFFYFICCRFKLSPFVVVIHAKKKFLFDCLLKKCCLTTCMPDSSTVDLAVKIKPPSGGGGSVEYA